MTLPSAFWQVKSITSNSMKMILVTGLVNECWLIVDLSVDILKDKRNIHLGAFHLRKTPLESIHYAVLSLWMKVKAIHFKPWGSYIWFLLF